MLTTTQIRTLKPCAARYTVTDARGLGLEVMPSGAKAWQLRNGNERLTLGHWPKMTLDAARVERAKFEAARAAGDTLRTVAAKIHGGTGQVTVAEFAPRYLKEVLERDRKDPRQLKRIIERTIVPRLGQRAMCWVTGAELRELIFSKRDQGKPSAAASLRNLLKRIWDYAIVCGAATANPALATPLKFIQRSTARRRTLSKREIGQFLRTLYCADQISHRLKSQLHMILLTLCRKSELQMATWAEINVSGAEWEIPSEHSKTGRPHIVYLSSQAMEILGRRRAIQHERLLRERKEEYIFHSVVSTTQPMSPGTLNRALARVKWGMPHFTIHDLRRTAATLLSEAGYPPDVIEKSLNHTIKGVRGVYNRAEYADQRREMLQAWADMTDKWRTEE